MKDIKWTVRYDSPPAALRYCKKCKTKREFISSGLFRVNAQGKYLDVWLIYKCSCCSSTWNAAVCSRTNPKSLPDGLLSRYQDNDRSLALQYAMDTAFLRRNGAEVQPPVCRIEGESFTMDEAVCLLIENEYPYPVKIQTLLRNKLKLSQRTLGQLVSCRAIVSPSGLDLKKCRLESPMVLHITGVSIP